MKLGRPKNPTPAPREILPERLFTPNRMLTILSESFPYDAGLITGTGKSMLEEKEGLEIFEEMWRDPQVQCCLDIKTYAALTPEWSVSPYSDSSQDKEVADFVQWVLEDVLGDNAMGLEPVMSAFAFGRSVTEIVWDTVKNGKYKGKLRISALKGKNIGFINYNQDEFGNVVSLNVNNIQGRDPIKVDPFKVIQYAWRPLFGNPYGRPDLAACYKWYWAKRALYKFMLIFADKYASPIPEFNLERGKLSDEEMTLLQDAAKNYHISNHFITPKGVKLTLHQSNGTAGSFYKEAIGLADSQMAKAILGQTLATNENAKTGTFAQSQTHENTLDKVLSKVHKDIEKTVVRDQMIKRLVDANFPNVEGYPKFRFSSLDPDTLDKIGGAVTALANAKDENGNSFVDIKEPWLRDAFDLPKRDLEEFPFRDKPLVAPGQMLDDKGNVKPMPMPSPAAVPGKGPSKPVAKPAAK